jgi:ribonuclease Z
MFDLHILGTSGSRPTTNRSVSGNYLSTPSGNIVIDCGEGFQNRLIKHELDLKNSPIGIRARVSKIKVILFTHSHFDHCWGLPPFLKTMQLDGRTKPLTIIAPSTKVAIEWTKKNYGSTIPSDSEINPSDFAILFREWQNHIESKSNNNNNNNNNNIFPIEWILIPVDGYAPINLPNHPLNDIQLTAIPTKHGVTSVGWLISSQNKVNRRILISGDTTNNVPAFNVMSLKGPLDLLIHEATFTNDLSEKADKHWHSTALDAARVAIDTKAKILGMVHFSPRIKDSKTIENEARKLNDKSFACEDGDIFQVDNNGEISLMRKHNNSWFHYDTS